jgi:hypothetical protein
MAKGLSANPTRRLIARRRRHVASDTVPTCRHGLLDGNHPCKKKIDAIDDRK